MNRLFAATLALTLFVCVLPPGALAQPPTPSTNGEIYGSALGIVQQDAFRTIQGVSNRLINNELFLSHGDSLFVDGPNDDLSLGKRSSGSGISSIVRGQESSLVTSGWVQGLGSGGAWQSDGNARGVAYNSGGVSYGFDLLRDDGKIVGITGNHTTTTFQGDQFDSGRINSNSLGVYGLRQFQSFYVLGVLNYGFNRMEVTRQIEALGVSQGTALGGLTGQQFGTYGELGTDLDLPRFRLQPFFALQRIMVMNGKSFESGAGNLNLTVNNSYAKSIQAHIGARLVGDQWIGSGGSRWTPYLSARWINDLVGHDRNINASFSGVSPFGTNGTMPGVNSGMAGFGLTTQVSDRLSLFANYDVQFATGFVGQSGSGGLVFEF